MKFPRAKFIYLPCLLAVIVAWSTPARAQTPPLPSLEVTPAVIPSGGTVTLSLPANFPLNNTRWRVGIWEHARPAYHGDIMRDFTVRDGALRATIRIEADPGAYDLRLVTNDKHRTALTQPAQILVPGIRREPGWWLFNGAPFAGTLGAATPAPVDAPLFMPGLKRDPKAKPKDLSRNISVPANGPLYWRVFQHADLDLDALTEPNYDFGVLRGRLAQAIQQARDKGERNYAGIGLFAGSPRPEQVAAAPAAIARLRQILGEVAPEAALILYVSGVTHDSVAAIDAYAALTDAVVLETNNRLDIWSIKAARRVAEEQPNYDLPIFVQREGYGIAGSVQGSKLVATGDMPLLDFWMGGATGFVLHSGDESIPHDEMPRWAELVQRNAPLFIGSVTLEDTGLLPTPDRQLQQSTEPTPGVYEALRGVQRVPLMARAGKGSTPESFVLWLNQRISAETIAQLRTAATSGARIYVEGTPDAEKPGDAESLASLLGGTFKRAIAEGAEGKTVTMTLEDPWIFGLSRGRQVPVEQRGEVTPIPGTLSGQVKAEKGKDVLTAPRIVAHLNDKSPALIINPVGKGEVVWLPFHLSHLAGFANGNAVKSEVAAKSDVEAQQQAIHAYYSAITAYLQPALVQVHAADGKTNGVENVRVALRRSPKGTLLVALMNVGGRTLDISATLNAGAGVALDLADEKELPLVTRGNHTTARVTIPANGWKLIAFAGTRKDLEQERNAKSLKARLR